MFVLRGAAQKCLPAFGISSRVPCRSVGLERSAYTNCILILMRQVSERHANVTGSRPVLGKFGQFFLWSGYLDFVSSYRALKIGEQT